MKSNDHNPLLTPEDRAALQAIPWHQPGRALTQAKDNRGLRPWMRAYAAWLAEQPSWPKQHLRCSRASLYAAERIQVRVLKILENRPDFVELRHKLEDDAVARARAKLETDLPWYVEKHREGLELATKEGDYRAYKDFTVPALERAWPRREGATIASANVTIVLTDRQAAELPAAPVMIEAELVDPHPDDPAGE